ncbi:hypothetical protein BD779DRAFT_1674756 [Infundibulicybe gibba]|nr:hypothetical protein BD779DRAFT_1674756 [Infundibulicybe gibba]
MRTAKPTLPTNTKRHANSKCLRRSPLDSSNSVDYPPTRTGSPSPGVAAIIRTKWKSTFSHVRDIIESNAGLLFVSASQGCLSLVNVAVKKLHTIDPPVSTMQARLKSLGFFGFFSLYGTYYSLQYLSLSDATALAFLAPLCTAIAGSLLLHEKFGTREALAGIFSLFGVILIARPTFIFGASSQDITLTGGNIAKVAVESTSSQRAAAVGAALASVLTGTGAYIAIRAVGKRAHPLHSLTSFSVQSAIMSTTYMIATKSPFVIPTRLGWLGLSC